jgi:hypothetical protein
MPVKQFSKTRATILVVLAVMAFGSRALAQQPTADSGVITLTVNGQMAAQTSYGIGSTPVTVAAGLAAGVLSGSPVTVTAVNDAIYLQATAAGSDDYSYSLVPTVWDSSQFSQASFMDPAAEGKLGGIASAPVYSYSVGYQPNSNIQNYTDSVMGTWTYGYDTLNRLTSGIQTAAPTDPLSPAIPTTNTTPTNYCWSYDSFGNRKAEQGSTSASGSPCSTTPYVYGPNNRVTGGPGVPYYDAAGDVTVDTNGNSYAYDGEGRLCAMSTFVDGMNIMTGYIYDAEGRRVAKGSITSFVCDPTTNGFSAAVNETDYVLDREGHQVTEMGSDCQRHHGVGAHQCLGWRAVAGHLQRHPGSALPARRDKLPAELSADRAELSGRSAPFLLQRLAGDAPRPDGLRRDPGTGLLQPALRRPVELHTVNRGPDGAPLHRQRT